MFRGLWPVVSKINFNILTRGYLWSNMQGVNGALILCHLLPQLSRRLLRDRAALRHWCETDFYFYFILLFFEGTGCPGPVSLKDRSGFVVDCLHYLIQLLDQNYFWADMQGVNGRAAATPFVATVVSAPKGAQRSRPATRQHCCIRVKTNIFFFFHFTSVSGTGNP